VTAEQIDDVKNVYRFHPFSLRPLHAAPDWEFSFNPGRCFFLLVSLIMYDNNTDAQIQEYTALALSVMTFAYNSDYKIIRCVYSLPDVFLL